MKILIMHLGNITDNLIASSVIKGLNKKYDNPEITWVVESKKLSSFFKILLQKKHNINIYSFCFFRENKNTFDLLINLNNKLQHELCPNVKIKSVIGLGFGKKYNKYYDYLYNNKKTNLNIFQIYYNLCNVMWKGEGYNISYYPRNKSKKNRIGIAVANTNLRNYVADNLDLYNLKNKKLWHIPYKKNIFKRMDEINRCEQIITDDYLTFHLSLFLRKYVYFLKTIPYNIKLEFFKQGECFNIPLEIIK